MDIQKVAPPLRKGARRMSGMPMGSAWGRALLRFLLRFWPSKKVPGVKLEVPRDAARMRLYRPAQQTSNAALLWIHGGGYMIGRAAQDDALCSDVCRRLGIMVVSADYRLAPEHPFPAPLDDCLAAWDWLQGAASSLNVDPERVAVGGESAGGGLAAGLVQRLQDRHGRRAAAQWLFCPMLDDRTAARRELDAENHFVWNNRLNAAGWRSYLGQEPGLPNVPVHAVPARRDNLAGFPPTWMGTGDIELFCAEDRTYAERLQQAGAEVHLELVPGAPHAFESWAADTEMAKAYMAGAQQWLGEVLNRRR